MDESHVYDVIISQGKRIVFRLPHWQGIYRKLRQRQRDCVHQISQLTCSESCPAPTSFPLLNKLGDYRLFCAAGELERPPVITEVGYILPRCIYSGRPTLNKTRLTRKKNAITIQMQHKPNEVVSYQTQSSGIANKATNKCVFPSGKERSDPRKNGKEPFGIHTSSRLKTKESRPSAKIPHSSGVPVFSRSTKRGYRSLDEVPLPPPERNFCNYSFPPSRHRHCSFRTESIPEKNSNEPGKQSKTFIGHSSCQRIQRETEPIIPGGPKSSFERPYKNRIYPDTLSMKMEECTSTRKAKTGLHYFGKSTKVKKFDSFGSLE